MVAPKPAKTPTQSAPKLEVICEPGRHVNCLHAKMAEKRAAKAGKA